MSIPITCGCGRSYKVADAMAGRRGRCPYCKATIVVPTFVPTPPQAQRPTIVVDADDFSLMPRKAAAFLLGLDPPTIAVGLIAFFAFAMIVVLAVRDAPGDHQSLERIVALGIGAAIFFVLLSPLIVPPISARRGRLSIQRWLIMALFCLCMAVISFFLFSSLTDAPSDRPLAYGTGFFAMEFLLGMAGCTLAAAIHRPAS